MRKISTQRELIHFMAGGTTLKIAYDGSFWLLGIGDFPVRVLSRVVVSLIKRDILVRRKRKALLLARWFQNFLTKDWD
jgi:hypothetical protein